MNDSFHGVFKWYLLPLQSGRRESPQISLGEVPGACLFIRTIMQIVPPSVPAVIRDLFCSWTGSLLFYCANINSLLLFDLSSGTCCDVEAFPFPSQHL